MKKTVIKKENLKKQKKNKGKVVKLREDINTQDLPFGKKGLRLVKAIENIVPKEKLDDTLAKIIDEIQNATEDVEKVIEPFLNFNTDEGIFRRIETWKNDKCITAINEKYNQENGLWELYTPKKYSLEDVSHELYENNKKIRGLSLDIDVISKMIESSLNGDSKDILEPHCLKFIALELKEKSEKLLSRCSNISSLNMELIMIRRGL